MTGGRRDYKNKKMRTALNHEDLPGPASFSWESMLFLGRGQCLQLSPYQRWFRSASKIGGLSFARELFGRYIDNWDVDLEGIIAHWNAGRIHDDGAAVMALNCRCFHIPEEDDTCGHIETH